MGEDPRKDLASELGKLLEELSKPSFMASLSTPHRNRLNTLLLAIDRARGTLVNVLLSEINARVAENEKALKDGIAALHAAIQKEEKVASVFKSIDSYLALLSKVLGFIV